MNHEFQRDFAIRRSHLKRYLAIVSSTERELRRLPLRPLAENKLNVLRAGTFLILYNLIESAARTSIESIHDQMRLARVPFPELRRSIRREVIKGFKKHGNPDLHQDMIDVPLELITAALNVDDHFSGNVDARRFREIAAIYGFSTDTNTTITREGASLLTIKDIRNDLSHGFKSYSEVGRDYPVKQLIEMSIRSTAFVQAVLGNVAHYLDGERFRESTTENVAA